MTDLPDYTYAQNYRNYDVYTREELEARIRELEEARDDAEAAYDRGYDDGSSEAESWAYDDGYTAGYDAGYEAAQEAED